jgi:adenylate cyclase
MITQSDGSFKSVGGLPARITRPEAGPLTQAASAQAAAGRQIADLRAELAQLMPMLGPPLPEGLAARLTHFQAVLGEMERSIGEANRTIESLRAERGQLQSLCVIAGHLNSTLDRATLFERVLSALNALVRAERAAIFLLDTSGHLRFEAAARSDGQRLARAEYEISQGAVEQVWRTQQPLVIENAQEHALLGDNPSVQGNAITSIMCAPLRAQDQALGVVYVDRRAGAGAFTNAHLDLLAAFCNEAAIALENANLYSTQQRHLLEIAAMKTYTDSILASISSGVLAIDNDGRITSANQAAERILHVNAKDIRGRPFDQVLAVIEDPVLLDKIRQTMGSAETQPPYLVRAPIAGRGGPFTLSVSWSALHNDAPVRLGTTIVIDDFTDLEQAQHVARLFRRYVHPDVVDLVTQNPGAAELGGAEREISVVFADIRDFTSLSEEMSPKNLVALLNEYLALLTEAVEVENGTVTMFQGDAVMAIFNAPLDQSDHAARAARAAWAMRQAIVEHRQHSGHRPVSFGIGVNTGMALVGNIGASGRLQNYTAIGDAVNTAQRLEEHATGNRVLLSDATYRLVIEDVRVGGSENIIAKGKSHPIRVWEMRGLA